MDIKKTPAAYQGLNWQPRIEAHNAEIKSGVLWNSACVNSEFNKLRKITIFIPSPKTPTVENVESVQHLEKINFQKLSIELNNLRTIFEQLGVKTYLISPVRNRYFSPELHYNLFYTRDLFFMTPEGVIISRMASKVRAGEEKHAAKTLTALGIPILRTIGGTGTFEGADALWLRKNLVIIGIGNRTNKEGFLQIKNILKLQGVKCLGIQLPAGIQHLLGILQIVDADLALVRKSYIPMSAEICLRETGYEILKIEESYEVRSRQSMNFVVVAPRKIVMIKNPITKNLYNNLGLEVIGEISTDELLKGAGGIGCATGILEREMV